MTAGGFLFAFAGYTVISYGYVLIRGWNIPWKSWVNPLAPYQWPSSGTPKPVPSTQVFPS